MTRCKAVTQFENGDVSRCSQQVVYGDEGTDLCYYHSKVRDGLAEPYVYSEHFKTTEYGTTGFESDKDPVKVTAGIGGVVLWSTEAG